MINTRKANATETIKEQLKLIYNGDPWYGGSITSVMDSVNPKLVFDSPGRGMHSIAELAAHMLAYRIFAEERLWGSSDPPPEQEQTFDWAAFSPDKKRVWNMIINRLELNQQNLLTLLDRYDDSILDQNVAGKPYSFSYLLTGILQHDLYHLGQIVYINKLLGNKSMNRKDSSNYDFNVFSFENLAHLK